MPEEAQYFPSAEKSVQCTAHCRITVLASDGTQDSNVQTVTYTPKPPSVQHSRPVYEKASHLGHRCKLVNSVRDLALSADNDLVGLADEFWIRASLQARADDPRRAVDLVDNYLTYRRRVQYSKSLQSLPESVSDLLSRGMFLVLGNCTRSGLPVLTIRFSVYQPLEDGFANAALAFFIVIEYMLREIPSASTQGIAVMKDFTNSTSKNIDVRFIRFVITSLSSVLPVQLKALYFIKPTRLIKLTLRFLTMFWTRKLRSAHFATFDDSNFNKMLQVFTLSHIPPFIDQRGSFASNPFQQQAFAENVIQKCLKWPKASLFNEDKYVWYSL